MFIYLNAFLNAKFVSSLESICKLKKLSRHRFGLFYEESTNMHILKIT